MEGISHEAISLAGHLKLNKLIVLFDDNQISIDGPTSLAVSDDQIARFEAVGLERRRGSTATIPRRSPWRIERARRSDRPTLIACKTIIGYGAPTKQGKASTHGSPLGRRGDRRARATSSAGRMRRSRCRPMCWRPGARAGARRGARARPGTQALASCRCARRGRPLEHPARRRCSGASRRRSPPPRRLAAAPPRSPRATRLVGGDAREAGPGAARADRRLGRPHRLQRHARPRTQAGRRAGRLRRQLHPLRRARACHGRRHERHGAARRPHPLRRHVPGLHRLLPAGDPPLRAHGPARHLRDDARLDRPRRGRPHAPAGRAPGEPAGHPQPQRVPPGRRRRDGGVLGAGGAAPAMRPRSWR